MGRDEELQREVENLRQALQTRTVIGQAQGILMERLGLKAEEAFAYLTRVSNDANVKLHTVADELILTRRLPQGGHYDSEESPAGGDAGPSA